MLSLSIKSFINVFLLLTLTVTIINSKDCKNKKPQSKLFCYYSKITDIDDCQCSYVILPSNSDVKSVERLKSTYKDTKILITVHEFNEVISYLY